jgi:hypothetical protein
MLCYAYAMLCYSILFIIIEYGFLVHVIDLKKREIILHWTNFGVKVQDTANRN